MPSPIPDAAPVTSAVLPSSCCIDPPCALWASAHLPLRPRGPSWVCGLRFINGNKQAMRSGAGEGMFRVRSPQDLGAGVVFILIGSAGILFGQDLAVGSAARMGPGYFPMLLSWLIIAIGLVLTVKSLATQGPPIPPIHLRPLTAIVAAILAFGLLIDRIGLALTAAVLVDRCRLCAARRRPQRNAAARGRPRAVHRRRLRLRAEAAAARLVGPLRWTSCRTSRPASAPRCRSPISASACSACLLGTLIGVLPGIGPIPTIAMLLPITFGLDPLGVADHARRHLLRRAVWRLDHLDPGEHSGRGRLDRHLHRRPPDGEAGPRRRGARRRGARLVLRRLRRHRVHRGVRSAARRDRAGIQLAGLFLADGARPRHRRGAGARLGASRRSAWCWSACCSDWSAPT